MRLVLRITIESEQVEVLESIRQCFSGIEGQMNRELAGTVRVRVEVETGDSEGLAGCGV